MSNPDPLDQLSAFRAEIDPDTRERHLDVIGSELRRQPPPPSRVGRRWVAGVVVAVVIAGPTAAVASDGAAPGDVLYAVKLALEPIVQLFDRDAVVEHRVEEVGLLIDRESEDGLIEERIAIARDALAETDRPRLERELDRIVDRWLADRDSTAPRPARDTTQTTEPAQSNSGPNDREPEPVEAPETSTTTDAVRDAPRPSDSATSTTTTPRDGPPPDDRPRDAP